MADRKFSIILSMGAFILLLVMSQAVPVTDNSNSEKGKTITEEKLFDDVVGKEEMDIILTPEQEDELHHKTPKALGSRHRQKRKILEKVEKRWGMPIFYKFDKSCSSDKRELIRGALSHWQDQTCIHFFEVNDSAKLETHHIIFTNFGSRCGSFVGKVDLSNMEPQKINLPEKCLKKFGTAVHEIGHALGLWHEHQRPDRDGHIQVVGENLVQWAHDNFDQAPHQYVDHFGLPYDFNSVMHYGATAGSTNGSPTLRTVDGLYQKNIGQRVELSFLDAKVINRAYCKAVCASPLPKACKHGGYQDPKDCGRCRCPDGMAGRYCEEIAPSTEGKCGGTINMGSDTTVTLTSPGYFDNLPYDNRVNCNWLIKVPKDHTVELMFLGDFSIYCHTDICYHWVEVRYKRNFEAPGPRFCCSTRPHQLIESEGEEMLVIFRTNWTSTFAEDRRGFNAILHAKPRSEEDENRVEGLFASRFRTAIAASQPGYYGDTSDPVEEVMTADLRKDKSSSNKGESARSRSSTTPKTTSTTQRSHPRSTTVTSQPTSTSSSTKVVKATSTTTHPTSTVVPERASGRKSDSYEYTWSEWTGCSGPINCKCGSCSSQTRQRLCSGAECREDQKVTQHRRCSRKCTQNDSFRKYIGTFYTVQCPSCCPGYSLVGNVCLPYKKS